MKTLGILFVSVVLFAGCKKKEETPAAGSASGSSAMGSSGSDTAGSSAMGSAAGSGSDTMAGSGSAMAGSGSAAGSAAGSGGDTMAGGGGIKDEADYEAKRTAAVEEMTAMIEADKADCKKLATDLTAYVDKNTQLIKDAKAYEKAHPDVKKKVDAKMKDKEKEQQKKMTPVMKTCTKDKDFMAAMKNMAEKFK